MKKYYLSSIFVIATLMLGACQSSLKSEEIVNDEMETKVEQDSSVEVAESQSTSTVTPIKTTYYDKSLFMLPLDHPYWETTTLNKETIRDMKERYGFIDEEVTVENENSEEESKEVSSEKNKGSEKESTENKTESTPSTAKPTTNQNGSTSINTSNSATNDSSSVSKPNNNNNNQSSSSTNQPTTPPVVEEKPQPQPPVQPSEPAPQPIPPVVEQPIESTPPVVEETKKPVDLLDWNYIKSTLIAKGESLGMSVDTSLTRDNQGYASPWQSSYMPVTNEDVIGYIGVQMEQCANHGWEFFNLEWVPQGDGNVNIYLIR